MVINMEVPATDPLLAPSAGKTHHDEGTFITSVTKARKDLDVATLPNGENITSLYGQLNSCISVSREAGLGPKSRQRGKEARSRLPECV